MSNLLLEAAATRPQDDMAEVLASFQSLLMRPVASGLVMASDADLRTRLLHESMAEPIRVPTADMFMESNKLLIAEMNIGRERYPWRPQDFHE